jgi:hypothetical protein
MRDVKDWIPVACYPVSEILYPNRPENKKKDEYNK